jgi:RHS repeat-associated protein
VVSVRFPGQYEDLETGLRYNYFRTYDPSTGRYLESDPIGLNGGLNTYGYGLQNPNSYFDSTGLDVEVLVGGPYGDTGYGHVALRVYGDGGGDCGCESYDNTYDFGRYGKQWGAGGSEGEGMMRVWSDFSKYIASQNAYGRTTTGYLYSTTAAQDAAIIDFYNQATQGITPNASRGDFMQQFRLPADYHAANNNCTTQALDGLGAGAPGLRNLLNGNQFDKGRGLSLSQKLGYRMAKDGNGVRMPLDLGAAAGATGRHNATNQYGN